MKNKQIILMTYLADGSSIKGGEFGCTVIPRLARFLIARICIARFFVGAKNNFHSTILYLSHTIK